MFPLSIRWALVACLVLIAGLAGCGDGKPKTYAIPGKVVYQNGAPLPGGSVVLQTTVDGKEYPARGMVQPDGTFQLTTFEKNDGVVAGEHKVSVGALPSLDGPTPTKPAVLAKYGDFATSGLTTTVAPDTKEIVITISK